MCLLTALSLSLPIMCVTACGNKSDTTPPSSISATNDSIRLNSDPEQSLNVGDEDKIIYDAKADGKVVKNAANFVSSNPAVVEVDEFGNIKAVGVGTATVTLSLKNNPSVTATVTYTVTKTFFMTKLGYCNGNVDVTTAEREGWVHIPEGDQTQILVSECAEAWYFSTKIEHSGKTGQDSSGRWGVGSFLVDDSNGLGEVMRWFGFKPTSHAEKKYTPYVGGWRVQSGGNDKEIEISTVMENASTATFEMIRNGAYYYCTVKVGNRVEKYIDYSPSLVGKPTYPGVYSQKQDLYISEFTATADPDEVAEKLNNFQTAESVKIEGLSDMLAAGETYNLKATVLPETTYNKSVTFALKTPVEGVSVSEYGVLDIGDGVTGEVTVVATAVSGENVTVERTYTVYASATSAHALFDTVTAVGAGYTLGDTGVTYDGATSGEAYIPLNVKATKWAVSFKSTLSAGKIGVYGIASGYVDYVSTVIDGGKLEYGLLGNEADSIEFNNAATNEVTVVRNGSFYLVIINGRLVERFYAPMSVDTVPAIYTDGAVGTVTDVEMSSGEAVDAIITANPYTIGKYVTVNPDGSYTLAARTFTKEGTNDYNWPPVNNYINGFKFADTVKGDFTIEFDLADISPIAVGGKIDSKILIYLKSETKTASLQLVFKSDDANPANMVAKFCPNLNDATWTEYDMPTGVNFVRPAGSDPIHIAIVKRANVVEFYIENSYYRINEGNPGLNNNGYWTQDTECTPGIGTFNCGMKVSNISLTVGSKSPVDGTAGE